MVNVNILLDKVLPIINKTIELGYHNDLKKEWLAEDLERILNVDKYNPLSGIAIFNNSSIRIELSKTFYLSMDIEIPSVNKKYIENLSIILDMIEIFNQEIKEIK